MGYAGTMLGSLGPRRKAWSLQSWKEHEGAQLGIPTELWEVDNPRNKNPLAAKRLAELILKELKQQESAHDSPPGSLKTISLCLMAIPSKRTMNSQGDVPPADAQRRETSPFTYVGILVVDKGVVSRYYHTTLSSQTGAKSPQTYCTENLSFNLPFSISYMESSLPASVELLKASVERVK